MVKIQKILKLQKPTGHQYNNERAISENKHSRVVSLNTVVGLTNQEQEFVIQLVIVTLALNFGPTWLVKQVSELVWNFYLLAFYANQGGHEVTREQVCDSWKYQNSVCDSWALCWRLTSLHNLKFTRFAGPSENQGTLISPEYNRWKTSYPIAHNFLPYVHRFVNLTS